MVEMEVGPGHVSAGNGALYVSVTCDRRESRVDAYVGRLVGGHLPREVGYLHSAIPGEAHEIPIQLLALLATGRREASFDLGSFRGSTAEEDVDAAVARLADALATYGGELLSDVDEWVLVGKQMTTALALYRATGKRLGDAFLGSIRERFGELFRVHGFVERESFRASPFAWVHSESVSLFLRAHCAFEDRLVTAWLGRLIDGSLPADWWLEPATAADVRRVPSTVIAWLETGDRDVSLGLGSYAEDSDEAIDAAVAEVAESLGRHGEQLLASDPAVWERVAELEIVRRLRRLSLVGDEV
jgi:hypothetical protein